MRIIVIGLGEVGRNIARTLTQERQDVILVDCDEARVAAVGGQIDALVVTGNGASPRFLEEIEARKADLLLAVTQSDEVNVIAALAAHQLGAKRTVARVRDPEYLPANVSYARDVLGIDFVIHSERATAAEMAEAILLPGAVQVEYCAGGRLAIAETILTERSPIVGIPLAERTIPHPHYVVGIIRDGHPAIATGREMLEPGDHVVLAAARDHIAQSVAYLAGTVRQVEEATLFGAGRIGLHLAHLLADSHLKLKILERDARRAHFVSKKLPGAEVVHEEGVGKDVMVAHGVDRVDAFVASAGDDRANLLAAFYAKEVGAGLCVATVSREEFFPLVSALKIDAAFSPRLITASEILRFVRSGRMKSLHLLLGGAEVMELQAEEDSPIAGRKVSDTGLPKSCAIGVIGRGDRVLFPLGHERIQAGDRVLIFAVTNVTGEVERAFGA